MNYDRTHNQITTPSWAEQQELAKMFPTLALGAKRQELPPAEEQVSHMYLPLPSDVVVTEALRAAAPEVETVVMVLGSPVKIRQ